MKSPAFAILLSLLAALPAIAQDRPASLRANVPVERDKLGDMWSPTRFYPGTSVTIAVEGIVTVYRSWHEVRECAQRILGICTKKENVWKIQTQEDRTARDFPVLAVVTQSGGQPLPAGALSPAPAPAPEFTSDPSAFVRLGQSTTLNFALAPVNNEREMMTGRTIAGYLGDRTPGGRPTQRSVCQGDSRATCGTGEYSTRLVGVDTSVRRAAILSMLRGPKALTVPGVLGMVDHWTVNTVQGEEIVRRSQAELKPISAALVFHYQSHLANVESAEPLLRLAVSLDADNALAQSELVALLVEYGKHTQASEILAESLPKRKRAYDEATAGTPGVRFAASIYYAYAMDLVSMGDAIATNLQLTSGEDVQSAAGYYRAASDVLAKLRASDPAVVDWTDQPQLAVKEKYLSALQKYASTVQLLRTPSAFDSLRRRS